MRLNDQQKVTFYDSIADDFDVVMNQYEVSKRLRIIFTELLNDDIKGKTLLDAGCGTGLFSHEAVKRGADVTSLDIGQHLLDQVSKKCQTKRVIGSVTELPFKDNSFDIVISTEVIEHTTSAKKAIAELCRVTKPGGTLIITTPNKVWKFAVWVANIFHLRPYHSYENWSGWSELSAEVKKNKMTIKKLTGFNILPLFNPILQPFITFMDHFGGILGPVMVNIVVMAKKNE